MHKHILNAVLDDDLERLAAGNDENEQVDVSTYVV